MTLLTSRLVKKACPLRPRGETRNLVQNGRGGSGSDNLAPKSRHTIRVGISADVLVCHRDRGILCGLASRWMCHYCLKIEPYYTDWNFGGCSHVHRHRVIVCGFAMHLTAPGLRTGHSNSKVCNCRKTEPAVGGTVPRTEKASKVTFLKRESP